MSERSTGNRVPAAGMALIFVPTLLWVLAIALASPMSWESAAQVLRWFMAGSGGGAIVFLGMTFIVVKVYDL